MTIVCGKNAHDNWKIIEESDDDHTWLHLNSFPSPHVIIRDSNPSVEQIMEAAKICKDQSKYSNIKNIKVVYTKIDNLVFGNEVGCVEFKSRRKCQKIIP